MNYPSAVCGITILQHIPSLLDLPPSCQDHRGASEPVATLFVTLSCGAVSKDSLRTQKGLIGTIVVRVWHGVREITRQERALKTRMLACLLALATLQSEDTLGCSGGLLGCFPRSRWKER